MSLPQSVARKIFTKILDRLKPLKRIRSEAGVYQRVEIEWEEALDLAADALASTIQKHGVDAVGAYFGNPQRIITA